MAHQRRPMDWASPGYAGHTDGELCWKLLCEIKRDEVLSGAAARWKRCVKDSPGGPLADNIGEKGKERVITVATQAECTEPLRLRRNTAPQLKMTVFEFVMYQENKTKTKDQHNRTTVSLFCSLQVRRCAQQVHSVPPPTPSYFCLCTAKRDHKSILIKLVFWFFG